MIDTQHELLFAKAFPSSPYPSLPLCLFSNSVIRLRSVFPEHLEGLCLFFLSRLLVLRQEYVCVCVSECGGGSVAVFSQHDHFLLGVLQTHH